MSHLMDPQVVARAALIFISFDADTRCRHMKTEVDPGKDPDRAGRRRCLTDRYCGGPIESRSGRVTEKAANRD